MEQASVTSINPVAKLKPAVMPFPVFQTPTIKSLILHAGSPVLFRLGKYGSPDRADHSLYRV